MASTDSYLRGSQYNGGGKKLGSDFNSKLEEERRRKLMEREAEERRLIAERERLEREAEAIRQREAQAAMEYANRRNLVKPEQLEPLPTTAQIMWEQKQAQAQLDEWTNYIGGIDERGNPMSNEYDSPGYWLRSMQANPDDPLAEINARRDELYYSNGEKAANDFVDSINTTLDKTRSVYDTQNKLNQKITNYSTNMDKAAKAQADKALIDNDVDKAELAWLKEQKPGIDDNMAIQAIKDAKRTTANNMAMVNQGLGTDPNITPELQATDEDIHKAILQRATEYQDTAIFEESAERGNKLLKLAELGRLDQDQMSEQDKEDLENADLARKERGFTKMETDIATAAGKAVGLDSATLEDDPWGFAGKSVINGLLSAASVLPKALRVGANIQTGSTLIDDGQGGFRRHAFSADNFDQLKEVTDLGLDLVGMVPLGGTAMSALKSGTKSLGKEIFKSGLTEGLTEGIQYGLEQDYTGQPFELSGLMESVAGGTLGGMGASAIIGAGSAIIGKVNKPRPTLESGAGIDAKPIDQITLPEGPLSNNDLFEQSAEQMSSMAPEGIPQEEYEAYLAEKDQLEQDAIRLAEKNEYQAWTGDEYNGPDDSAHPDEEFMADKAYNEAEIYSQYGDEYDGPDDSQIMEARQRGTEGDTLVGGEPAGWARPEGSPVGERSPIDVYERESADGSKIVAVSNGVSAVTFKVDDYVYDSKEPKKNSETFTDFTPAIDAKVVDTKIDESTIASIKAGKIEMNTTLTKNGIKEDSPVVQVLQTLSSTMGIDVSFIAINKMEGLTGDATTRAAWSPTGKMLVSYDMIKNSETTAGEAVEVFKDIVHEPVHATLQVLKQTREGKQILSKGFELLFTTPEGKAALIEATSRYSNKPKNQILEEALAILVEDRSMNLVGQEKYTSAQQRSNPEQFAEAAKTKGPSKAIVAWWAKVIDYLKTNFKDGFRDLKGNLAGTRQLRDMSIDEYVDRLMAESLFPKTVNKVAKIDLESLGGDKRLASTLDKFNFVRANPQTQSQYQAAEEELVRVLQVVAAKVAEENPRVASGKVDEEYARQAILIKWIEAIRDGQNDITEAYLKKSARGAVDKAILDDTPSFEKAYGDLENTTRDEESGTVSLVQTSKSDEIDAEAPATFESLDETDTGIKDPAQQMGEEQMAREVTPAELSFQEKQAQATADYLARKQAAAEKRSAIEKQVDDILLEAARDSEQDLQELRKINQKLQAERRKLLDKAEPVLVSKDGNINSATDDALARLDGQIDNNVRQMRSLVVARAEVKLRELLKSIKTGNPEEAILALVKRGAVTHARKDGTGSSYEQDAIRWFRARGFGSVTDNLSLAEFDIAMKEAILKNLAEKGARQPVFTWNAAHTALVKDTRDAQPKDKTLAERIKELPVGKEQRVAIPWNKETYDVSPVGKVKNELREILNEGDVLGFRVRDKDNGTDAPLRVYWRKGDEFSTPLNALEALEIMGYSEDEILEHLDEAYANAKEGGMPSEMALESLYDYLYAPAYQYVDKDKQDSNDYQGYNEYGERGTVREKASGPLKAHEVIPYLQERLKEQPSKGLETNGEKLTRMGIDAQAELNDASGGQATVAMKANLDKFLAKTFQTEALPATWPRQKGFFVGSLKVHEVIPYLQERLREQPNQGVETNGEKLTRMGIDAQAELDNASGGKATTTAKAQLDEFLGKTFQLNALPATWPRQESYSNEVRQTKDTPSWKRESAPNINLLETDSAKTESAQPKTETIAKFTSGGAKGADSFWAKTLNEAAGRKIVDEIPSGDPRVDENYDDVVKAVAKAAKRIGKFFPREPYPKGLIFRNFIQIKDASHVVAIIEYFDEKLNGFPHGGTGWGVAMAVDKGQKIAIFNQADNTWYTWDYKQKKFVPKDSLDLEGAERVAVIGSRELGEAGKTAIQQVVKGMKDNGMLDDAPSLEESAKEPAKTVAKPTEAASTGIDIWAGKKTPSQSPDYALSALAQWPFEHEGVTYQSVEQAYQKLKKTVPKSESLALYNLLMEENFDQNPARQEILLKTGDKVLTHKNGRKTDIADWSVAFPEVLTKLREKYRSRLNEAAPVTLQEEVAPAVPESKSVVAEGLTEAPATKLSEYEMEQLQKEAMFENEERAFDEAYSRIEAQMDDGPDYENDPSYLEWLAEQAEPAIAPELLEAPQSKKNLNELTKEERLALSAPVAEADPVASKPEVAQPEKKTPAKKKPTAKAKPVVAEELLETPAIAEKPAKEKKAAKKAPAKKPAAKKPEPVVAEELREMSPLEKAQARFDEAELSGESIPYSGIEYHEPWDEAAVDEYYEDLGKTLADSIRKPAEEKKPPAKKASAKAKKPPAKKAEPVVDAELVETPVPESKAQHVKNAPRQVKVDSASLHESDNLDYEADRLQDEPIDSGVQGATSRNENQWNTNTPGPAPLYADIQNFWKKHIARISGEKIKDERTVIDHIIDKFVEAFYNPNRFVTELDWSLEKERTAILRKQRNAIVERLKNKDGSVTLSEKESLKDELKEIKSKLQHDLGEFKITNGFKQIDRLSITFSQAINDIGLGPLLHDIEKNSKLATLTQDFLRLEKAISTVYLKGIPEFITLVEKNKLVSFKIQKAVNEYWQNKTPDDPSQGIAYSYLKELEKKRNEMFAEHGEYLTKVQLARDASQTFILEGTLESGRLSSKDYEILKELNEGKTVEDPFTGKDVIVKSNWYPSKFESDEKQEMDTNSLFDMMKSNEQTVIITGKTFENSIGKIHPLKAFEGELYKTHGLRALGTIQRDIFQSYFKMVKDMDPEDTTYLPIEISLLKDWALVRDAFDEYTSKHEGNTPTELEYTPQGREPIKLDERDIQDFISSRENNQKAYDELISSNDIVRYWSNGKEYGYRVPKEIYSALSWAPIDSRKSLIAKIFRVGAAILKGGSTTFNIPFQAKQLPMDLIQALQNSPSSQALVLKDTILAAPRLLFNVEFRNELTRVGAIQRWNERAGQKTYVFKNSFSKAKRAVDFTFAFVDNLVRAGVYQSSLTWAIKNGMDNTKPKAYGLTEAELFAARNAQSNTSDFLQRGRVIAGVTSITGAPYVSSGFAGAASIANGFRMRPAKSIRRLLTTVVLMGVAYAMINGDPDKKKVYDELPDFIKGKNIPIIDDGAYYDAETNTWSGVVLIPVSQYLYPTATILAKIVDGNNENAQEFTVGLIVTSINTLSGLPISGDTAPEVLGSALAAWLGPIPTALVQTGTKVNIRKMEEFYTDYEQDLMAEGKRDLGSKHSPDWVIALSDQLNKMGLRTTPKELQSLSGILGGTYGRDIAQENTLLDIINPAKHFLPKGTSEVTTMYNEANRQFDENILPLLGGADEASISRKRENYKTDTVTKPLEIIDLYQRGEPIKLTTDEDLAKGEKGYTQRQIVMAYSYMTTGAVGTSYLQKDEDAYDLSEDKSREYFGAVYAAGVTFGIEKLQARGQLGVNDRFYKNNATGQILSAEDRSSLMSKMTNDEKAYSEAKAALKALEEQGYTEEQLENARNDWFAINPLSDEQRVMLNDNTIANGTLMDYWWDKAQLKEMYDAPEGMVSYLDFNELRYEYMNAVFDAHANQNQDITSKTSVDSIAYKQARAQVDFENGISKELQHQYDQTGYEAWKEMLESEDEAKREEAGILYDYDTLRSEFGCSLASKHFNKRYYLKTSGSGGYGGYGGGGGSKTHFPTLSQLNSLNEVYTPKGTKTSESTSIKTSGKNNSATSYDAGNVSKGKLYGIDRWNRVKYQKSQVRQPNMGGTYMDFLKGKSTAQDSFTARRDYTRS